LAISLRLDCEVRGIGINPLDPPLRWEAWTSQGWAACDVVSDDTGGLNGAGDVVLIVPRDHTASVEAGERASWLRARLIKTAPNEPTYTASPRISSVTARTAGGVTAAIHAETVEGEILGLSEGVAGQQFALARRPVIDDGDLFEVEVGGGGRWEKWTEVRHGFADQPEDATVVRVDRGSGIVYFPPAVREPKARLRQSATVPSEESEPDASLRDNGALPSEGSESDAPLRPNGAVPSEEREHGAPLRHYGAVPPKGAPLRVLRYRVGGGARGNVAPRALSTLRTTVPFVRGCQNRSAAYGGVDGETLEEAKLRGPLTLRALDRAVTLEDYEHLAKQAAPGIARVEAVTAVGADGGQGVRVLVVPTTATGTDGRLAYQDLIPSPEVLRLIAEDLDARRTVGARISVERPSYKAVTIVARLIARPRVAVEPLHREALAALYRWFDPARGGADGHGWPLGRSVLAGEVYSVLQSLPGAEFIEDLQLFEAEPGTAPGGEPAQRIDLKPDELVFGFAHSIRVTAGI
jgi:predicted phage baseplate assembly protein